MARGGLLKSNLYKSKSDLLSIIDCIRLLPGVLNDCKLGDSTLNLDCSNLGCMSALEVTEFILLISTPNGDDLYEMFDLLSISTGTVFMSLAFSKSSLSMLAHTSLKPSISSLLRSVR